MIKKCPLRYGDGGTRLCHPRCALLMEPPQEGSTVHACAIAIIAEALSGGTAAALWSPDDPEDKK